MNTFIIIFLSAFFIGKNSSMNAASITKESKKNFENLVRKNRIDDVKKTLKEYAGDENKRNLEELLSDTLMIAIQNKNSKMVNLLLEHNANPNEKNSLNETPLHSAAELGLIEIITELLNKGANPETCNYNLERPYDLLPHNFSEQYTNINKDQVEKILPVAERLEPKNKTPKATEEERERGKSMYFNRDSTFFPKTMPFDRRIINPAAIIYLSMALLCSVATSDYDEAKETLEEKKSKEAIERKNKEKENEQALTQEKNNLKEDDGTIKKEDTNINLKTDMEKVTISSLVYVIKNPKKHKLFYAGLTGILYSVFDMYSENAINKKILAKYPF